jgi:hypothetical protein
MLPRVGAGRYLPENAYFRREENRRTEKNRPLQEQVAAALAVTKTNQFL